MCCRGPIRDFEGSVSRLLEFLRIPSISTDPSYREHCLKAARWTQGLLETMGFGARLVPTPANPVVIGRYEPDQVHPGMLHILLYGHYDVQPPDPIELWKTPPFEPSRRKEKDGIERIYARGACDDKGQVMTMLEASRAWLRNRGRLPFKADRPDRRRRGIRLFSPRRFSRRTPQGARGRPRTCLRHIDVGCGRTRHNHQASRLPG